MAGTDDVNLVGGRVSNVTRGSGGDKQHRRSFSRTAVKWIVLQDRTTDNSQHVAAWMAVSRLTDFDHTHTHTHTHTHNPS